MRLLDSWRPAIHRRGSFTFSRGTCCCLLAASLSAAAASPATAQEPEPEPAPPPTLPAPDPAPPVPPRRAPTPAPPPPPAATPRAAPSPRYVPPEVVAPDSQPTFRPSPPERATPKAPVKAAAPKPVEPLRRLPTRDPPIVRIETLQVLSSAGLVRSVDRDDVDGGLSAAVVAAGFWLGLASALLLVAFLTPLLAVGTPFGARLFGVRGRLAVIATNMILALVVGYLVVGASS
jgi:hypothetical protein